MDNFLDPHYVLGALRRRWLVIVLPTAVGVLLSLLVSFILPATYVSTARILVESQQIPSDLARSTVAAGATERIQLIEERIKTRENMLALADRFDIFAAEPELTRTERVQRMRQATTIRTVGLGSRRTDNTSVLTVAISFAGRNPGVTSQMANELLTQVLSQNIEQRSARASETLRFFTDEAQRLTEALKLQEQRIAEFKIANQLSLPDSINFRQTEMQDLRRDRDLRRRNEVSLSDTRDALQRALDFGPTASERPEQTEIDRLRAELVQLSSIYAPTHPRLRALESRIGVLEASLATSAPAPAAPSVSSEPDPISREAEIRRQIARIEEELALIETADRRDEERMATLETALARGPDVAIALSALERDRERLQAQFARVAAKQAEAATGERLEVNQQAERFEVIETPQTPEQPVSPNRVLIASAGSVASAGLGVALALLLELVNPRLRTLGDFERRLNLRPIAAIPYVQAPRERIRRRLSLRLALFLLVVMIPVGAFAVDRYVAPLSILVERAADRIGLHNALALVRARLQ